MPNWMSNTLTVRGPEQELVVFKQKAALTAPSIGSPGGSLVYPLSFESFVPMPESLNADEDYKSKMALNIGLIAYQGRQGLTEVLNRPEIKKVGIQTLEGLQLFLDVTCPEARASSDRHVKNIEDYGFASWYDWRLAHWGTKWDASDAELSEESATQFTYYFFTAWSAPEPVIEAMSRQHPLLQFEGTFDEPGNGVYFSATWENGEKLGEQLLERPTEDDSDEQEDAFDAN